MMPKADVIPGGYREDVLGWNEKSFNLLEFVVLDEAPPGYLNSRYRDGTQKSHLRGCLGEFTLTLEEWQG